MKLFGFNLSKNMLMAFGVLTAIFVVVVGYGWIKSRFLVQDLPGKDDESEKSKPGDADREQQIPTNNVQITPDRYPQQPNQESTAPTNAPPVGSADGDVDDNLQQGQAPPVNNDRIAMVAADDSPLDYNEHIERETNLAQLNLEDGMQSGEKMEKEEKFLDYNKVVSV
jgi:hypothetical protein